VRDRVTRALPLCVGVALVLGLLVSTSACAGRQNSWIDLKPKGVSPSARFGEALVYVSQTGKVFMFGGRATEQAPLHDAWMYDPQKNRWTELTPRGDVPPARWATASAYDPIANRVVIFGGMGEDGAFLDDTWAYSVAENDWARLSPSASPSPRTPPTRRSSTTT